MDLFNSLFGFEVGKPGLFSNDDHDTKDSHDFLDNGHDDDILDDDENLDDDDYEDNDDDSEDEDYSYDDSEDVSYSVAKVRVMGYDYLDDDDKEYIIGTLKEGDYVYLRNEFDNPVNPDALLVMHHNRKLGYIEDKKCSMLLRYLRNGKIGTIRVSSIVNKDFEKLFLYLDVYYKDPDGYEECPPRLSEKMKCYIYELDKWTNPKDWTKDWYMDLQTDALCYKYNELYPQGSTDEEKGQADAFFTVFILGYLHGTSITRADMEESIQLWELAPATEKVIRVRIEAWMKAHDYHFAKEGKNTP